MTDRERNTFKYKGYDVTVERDEESVSGISFLVPNRELPGKSYYAFAYFDEIDKFILCGCNWDKFLGKN